MIGQGRSLLGYRELRKQKRVYLYNQSTEHWNNISNIPPENAVEVPRGFVCKEFRIPVPWPWGADLWTTNSPGDTTVPRDVWKPPERCCPGARARGDIGSPEGLSKRDRPSLQRGHRDHPSWLRTKPGLQLTAEPSFAPPHKKPVPPVGGRVSTWLWLLCGWQSSHVQGLMRGVNKNDATRKRGCIYEMQRRITKPFQNNKQTNKQKGNCL